MHKIALVMVAMGSAMAPARAQLGHTWVATYGSNASNCDFPTPCATLSGAYAKTTIRGEITCVDSGNFGGVTITSSITIDCENAIASNGYSGLFYIGTAATDVVTLRGLDLNGLGSSFNGGGLINFTGAGVLHVHKVKMGNVKSGIGAIGINFLPSGAAKLFVADSIITDNGNDSVTGGIIIKPAAGVEADVTIDHTRIENNLFGIIADGTAGGTIRGVVRDSVVTGNASIGITAGSAPSSSVILLIDNTTVTNSNYGLVANGTTAGLVVGRSSIMFNNTGLLAIGGGGLASYQDNRLGGNGTDGAFTLFAGLR